MSNSVCAYKIFFSGEGRSRLSRDLLFTVFVVVELSRPVIDSLLTGRSRMTSRMASTASDGNDCVRTGQLRRG